MASWACFFASATDVLGTASDGFEKDDGEMDELDLRTEGLAKFAVSYHIPHLQDESCVLTRINRYVHGSGFSPWNDRGWGRGSFGGGTYGTYAPL
jgi:hypothetical protein